MPTRGDGEGAVYEDAPSPKLLAGVRSEPLRRLSSSWWSCLTQYQARRISRTPVAQSGRESEEPDLADRL